FMSEVAFKNGSPKVKVEGKAWAHHTAPTEHNNGNTIGLHSVPCQSVVKVVAPTPASAAASGADAAATADGGAAGQTGKGNGGGKPCACKKSTSRENRRAVNEKDEDGNDPKCPACNKSGPQVQREMINAITEAGRRSGSALEKIEAAKLLSAWSRP